MVLQLRILSKNFNPHSHERSDNICDLHDDVLDISIHTPMKGATRFHFAAPHPRHISIHTPTKGATLSICEQLYETRISIHTPTKGATMVFATYSEDGGISIHTPTKGATVKKFTQLFSCIFQSTLPRRERQRLRHRLPVRLCISIHTPTKGATRSDILRKCAGVEISIHTPTKGATRLLKKPHIRCVYFNPHSHEGSDLFST